MLLPFLCFVLILASCIGPPRKSYFIDYGDGSQFDDPEFLQIADEKYKGYFSCFNYMYTLLLQPEIPELTGTTFEKSVNKSGYCRFNVLLHQGLSHVADNELVQAARDESVEWFCELDDELVCDGMSQCLTDECG